MATTEDVAGFCASVDIAEVAKLDYVLTPGRYVILADEDDFDFKNTYGLKAGLKRNWKKKRRV